VETPSADWSAGYGKILTQNIIPALAFAFAFTFAHTKQHIFSGAFDATKVDLNHCRCVLKNLYVTCALFGETTSADWSAKEEWGNVIPEMSVFCAPNAARDLQLARAAMSPTEHSRKHRQRTGPRKKGPL